MGTPVSGLSMTLKFEGCALANSRSFTLNMGQDLMDVTSRSSSQWSESLLARRNWSIDFDGLWIYNDPAKKVLMAHFEDKTPVSITVVATMPDGATYTGEAYLTSYSVSAPYEDALTASGSLQGTAGLTISVS